MPTITYVVTQRGGPFDSLENAEGSSIQINKRSWTFTVSCSFHGQHTVRVLDPYTGASVRLAVEEACKTSYQSAPEVGLSWSQTW